ncbi:uncharacterized protein ALTATR162_LOCUS4525 [Alternaria atra]|uniref:Ubiquitin-like domain-containing protein n=1 Tax=Alternaria atra TaxID=119953 RepID=A0A8J2N0Y9_9PLEO|nr:uncharacterized protein ALTATR162_LOCUS4525 [Alternaria atra]CAG5156729.1 unnamed protein product [Alternaria atra]
MGCCASRTSDDGPPAVRAHSSSRNITAPSTRPSSIPSPRPSHASHDNAHPPRANDRPNSPLKPIPSTQRSRLPNTLASTTTKTSSRVKPLTDSTNLTWTPSRLEKERGDWWDTQVTGSEQIWRAIRLVAQYLKSGELQEAQTMLDAIDCTCPTGLLWRGVYDPTGVQYKVPEWVIVEPEGLAEEGDEEDKDIHGDASSSAMHETLDDAVDDKSNSLIRVRVRTSHDQKDVLLVIRMKDSVATITEKLKEQAKLDPTVIIRLAYGGRVYQDSETLESQPYWDFANNFVLTALVFQ